MESLEELYLGGLPLVDGDLTFLTSLAGLKAISLAYTDISDEGLSRLSALSHGTRCPWAFRWIHWVNTEETP